MYVRLINSADVLVLPRSAIAALITPHARRPPALPVGSVFKSTARPYHCPMSSTSPSHVPASVRGGALLQWFTGWWQIVHLGALILVLALSPSTYERATRATLAREVYQASAPILLWFLVLSSLISLVIIRIVVVTALSYGLSRYSLQMVVRVLVLELIPLTTALFVALRVAIPNAAEIAALRVSGEFDALTKQGIDPLRQEVLPRMMAGMFSVLMLAAVSCVVTLVLAYLTVHGFTTAALGSYTRAVGHVFAPVVILILTLKTFLFSLAVALIPIATVAYESRAAWLRMSAELQGLVRLFSVILLIEMASLVGNYY